MRAGTAAGLLMLAAARHGATASPLAEGVSILHSPNRGDVRLVHDAAGRLRFWMDAAGAAAGRQVPNAHPRIGYRTYDAAGRMLEEGLLADRAFDAARLGVLAQRPDFPLAGSSPQWRRRYAYGPQGQLIEVLTRADDRHAAPQGVPAVHRLTLFRDEEGRVLRAREQLEPDGPGVEIAYHYDASGRVVEMAPRPVDTAQAPQAWPVVLYRYDIAGRVSDIGRAWHGVRDPSYYARYRYRADGQVATELRHAGAAGGRFTIDYEHGADGLLSGLSVSRKGLDDEPSLAFAQTLQRQEGAGDHRRIIGLEQADDRGVRLRQRFLYAPDGALAEAQSPGAIGASRLGFRALQRGDKGDLLGWQHGAGPPQAADDAHEQRDANGNVQAVAHRFERIDHDPFFNLPTRVVMAGGQAEMRYGYGGLQAERAWSWQRQENQAQQQLYARGLGEQPQAILRAAGEGGAAPSQLRLLVWGPTGLVAVDDVAADTGDSQGTRFVVADHLGSTVQVWDERGRLQARLAYGPTGRVADDEQGTDWRGEAPLPYLFQGQEYDAATGLHNFRARLYDSEQQRFLAPDPLAQAGVSPYLAMGGDTVNRVDPDGRFWMPNDPRRRRAWGPVVATAAFAVATAPLGIPALSVVAAGGVVLATVNLLALSPHLLAVAALPGALQLWSDSDIMDAAWAQVAAHMTVLGAFGGQAVGLLDASNMASIAGIVADVFQVHLHTAGRCDLTWDVCWLTRGPESERYFISVLGNSRWSDAVVSALAASVTPRPRGLPWLTARMSVVFARHLTGTPASRPTPDSGSSVPPDEWWRVDELRARDWATQSCTELSSMLPMTFGMFGTPALMGVLSSEYLIEPGCIALSDTLRPVWPRAEGATARQQWRWPLNETGHWDDGFWNLNRRGP